MSFLRIICYRKIVTGSKDFAKFIKYNLVRFISHVIVSLIIPVRNLVVMHTHTHLSIKPRSRVLNTF